jgi:hypothetical protein
MPLTKLEWKPGVIKDDTPLVTEGGWTDADKVRFVRDRPQTIGGWDRLITDTFEGIARGAHAWGDVQGHKFLAWGTAAKLYVVLGGAIKDITPVFDEGVGVNALTTTSGSTTVQVTHVAHGLSTGQVATYTNQQTPVGGLTLNGPYPVTVIDPDHYTVVAASAATSSAGPGGGGIDYSYSMTVGRVDGVGAPSGFGAGYYGGPGGYGGTITSAATQPRTWTMGNFGENLVAVPRGGPLFEYQPSIGPPPELLSNGQLSSPTGWTLGSGWTISGGVATAVAGTASNLSHAAPLEAGAVYRVEFDVTATAGSVSFTTNGPALAGGASKPISKSGHYSRMFRATAVAPGTPLQIVFAKDATFAGTIDNVSVKLADKAYRIQEAPPANEGVFVDPNGIIVLYGTSAHLDTFNQMALHWSDLQDITMWVPTASNLAGDAFLSTGARIVGAKVSRTQNLVWTDTALYSMTYTGDASEPFIFRLTGTGCGLIGPLAAIEHNGQAYWLSKDNVFAFQGVSPVPIPCPLRRDLFDNLTGAQQEKIAAGIISGFSEVWWFYPDKRDASVASTPLNLECSRYVSFHLDGNIWSCGTFNRTSWVGSGVYENPIGFGTDGRVYAHERGQSDAGGPFRNFISAAYLDIQDGDALTHVRRVVPDFEGQVGPVRFDFYYKRFPNAAEVHKGQYEAAENREKIDLRLTARQIAIKLSANTAPTFARLGALRFDILPTGQLR